MFLIGKRMGRRREEREDLWRRRIRRKERGGR
jgi:hypothetical protein